MITDIQSPLSKSDTTQTQKNFKTPSFLSPMPSRSNEINYQNLPSNAITPLYNSIITANPNETKELLESGADPNIKSRLGETPLFQAVEMNNISQVASLLNFKADPNIVNDEGIAPLHIAVLRGNKLIISHLLKCGANPNLQSISTGQTPLHFAYQQYPYEEIVSILMKYGALNSIIDKNNKKPSDYKEQGVAYSENITNTNQENTFTLDNHLDSFATSNKDELSKIINIREGNESIQTNLNVTYNKIEMNNSINTNIFKDLENVELNEENANTIQTPKKDKDDNENDINLNDSLEDDNDFNYSKSKSYYFSNFPLSSMKRENIRETTNSNQEMNQINQNIIKNNFINLKNNEDENIYKKLIIAKRLSYCNNKLSYHVKINNNFSNNIKNNNKVTLNTDRKSNYPSNTTINNTCIHNSEHNLTNSNTLANNNMNKLSSYLNSTTNNANQNLTDLEINPYNTINKQSDNNYSPNINNNYSNFSTAPHSNKICYSLRSKKKFQSHYYDNNNNNNNNNSYEKVSEFSINKISPRNCPPGEYGYHEVTLSKLKKWLQSIDLEEYTNTFIKNGYVDISLMIKAMKSYQTKLKFEDFEDIGIKKPGHIYRIITKLEIDSDLIDSKIVQFILPVNKFGDLNLNEKNNCNGNNLNLKISDEYYCGCISAKVNERKKDLKMWLRKNNLINYLVNFTHNGFDNLEFVMLQMYSTYTINEEILENCFHIYEEKDRKNVLISLVDEMKKINTFVDSKEYSDNQLKYKYANIQLEKEDEIFDKENCNACIVF